MKNTEPPTQINIDLSKFEKDKVANWNMALDDFKKWRVKQGKLFKKGKGAYVSSNEKEKNYFSFLIKFGNLDGNVLDIGCGGGHIRKYLPSNVNYYGIDPIVTNENDKDIVKGIGEKIPFEDDYFNYIICYASLDHVLDVEKVFQEANRVIKANGGFIIANTTLDKQYLNINENLFSTKIKNKIVALIRFLKLYVAKIIKKYDTHTYHFTILQLINLFQQNDFSRIEITTIPFDDNSIIIKGQKETPIQ